MTCKLKQNIRCQKAQERMLRKIYPRDTQERKLVQLSEKQDDLAKWSSRVWESMNRRGFVPTVDNSNPAFFSSFDELAMIEKMQTRVSKSIDSIESKGVTMKQALETMYRINAGRGSASY